MSEETAKKRKTEELSMEKDKAHLLSVADKKYFSYRFESVGTARPHATDNCPCGQAMLQKYIAVSDRSVDAKSVAFWATYFRTLLRADSRDAKAMDNIVYLLKLLPHTCDGYPHDVMGYKDKLRKEALLDLSDDVLYEFFTVTHGWGEEDFVAGGAIEEVEFEDF